MNQQDLDRIIDTATAEMIAGEPKRELRCAVMARVRESEPTVPRRLVWAAGGLAAAACLVIALVVMEWPPSPAIQIQTPARPDRMAEPPAATVEQSAAALKSATPVAQSVARRVQRLPLAPNDLPSTIEAITSEPLVLPSIDLPPLENQAAPVEQIEIDTLTIEPLTASNDEGA